MKHIVIVIVVGLVLAGAWWLFGRGDGGFSIPKGGEAVPLEQETSKPQALSSKNSESRGEGAGSGEKKQEKANSGHAIKRSLSTRQILVTEGEKHSIPLDEVLKGIPLGNPRDAIPAIDTPKFISTKEADTWLDDKEDIGLGIAVGGEARFYPYQILVFHEIVNDTIAGEPVLVTYCPLCMTGIAFERKVRDEVQEFGVSGFLWQSNLLMYNRGEEESLWSQVLGEAVVGQHTGERLAIVPSDTVRYGEWKSAHPETQVLSRETGEFRSYGQDPYGDYYTEERVYFPVSTLDDRLPQKAFVLGIEVDGKFKAYEQDALPIGATRDTFMGESVIIEKSDAGEVRVFVGEGREPLPYIGGFWFSWVAVHPETELYK